MLHSIQLWFESLNFAPTTIIGLMALTGLLFGKLAGKIHLPSIIGFLIVGVLIGPSVLGILTESGKGQLGFITDVALGFVALSIGLELKMSTLKSLGGGIIAVIFAESIFAFIFVTFAVYLASRDLPLSILFGALAPASAPAGTVAVIREYKASGTLTKALYAIVGFDDGLAIIIFGFAAAVARSIIAGEQGATDAGGIGMLVEPLRDIGLSTLIGGVIATLYSLAVRLLDNKRDIFVLTFGAVLITIGICNAFGASLIFTNLVMGIFVINFTPDKLARRITESLTDVMPLLFVLFFVLAGANLHLASLPALGLIGAAYIISRSGGQIFGAWFGAVIGRMEKKIRNLAGLGILSQAGVAIGLALLVKNEFREFGAWGDRAGEIIVTTITATSIVFEVIGPLLTRYALKRAGEIPES